MGASPYSGMVVVGIDGSDTAVLAAQWAAREAAARDVPLRLVYATGSPDQHADLTILRDAEQRLRSASSAVHAQGVQVKIETAIKSGSPVAALIEESRDADLLCVGSTGIGRLTAALLGSTCAEVADRAYCPVAIIRPGEYHREPTPEGWIIVPVNAFHEDEHVVETAMDVARHSRSPVLAVGVWRRDFGETLYDELDHRVAAWKQRYPDVRVHAVATGSTIAEFLADYTEPVRLVVIGTDDTDQIPAIVGPYRHSLADHGECSVLVARS